MLAQGCDSLVEYPFRTGGHDGVVNMIHRELRYATLQGQTFFIRSSVGEFVQMEDHGQVVGQPFVDTLGSLLVDG